MNASLELEEALESTLLLLGEQERKLGAVLKEFREAARQAVRDGRLDEADAAMTRHERARQELTKLEASIMQVERKLYALRRQRRR